MLNYLILTSGVQGLAIALALSPGNFSIGFALREPGHSDIKSGISISQSLANPQPDTAFTALADGVYLYGQSNKPDEIKKEYFVFETWQSKVIGAFYLPQSAFYCFYGNVDRTQLNLTVVDTYDGTSSPYSVNLQRYQQLSALSDNDRRILGICKESHKPQVWGK